MAFWDKETVIGEVQKTDKTKLVVKAVEKDGKKMVNIWEFYRTEKNPEWSPGSKGMTLPLEKVDCLCALLKQAAG